MSDDTQERLKVVALGIEAERFLESDLGRYLVARAEGEREEAIAELVKVDPHDSREVQRLQNAIAVVDMVQQWIADAITSGQATERALVAEDIEAGQ